MTFALSYHPNVPALLTQPRLFIGPEVPACVSAQGNVLIPMTLDGRLTDTRLKGGNLKGLARFIERHEDRFVSSAPRLQIYPSKENYEANVHPGWLTRVTEWIDHVWERYRAVLAEHPLQRIVLQAVKGQMQSLHPLFSACLYVGDYGMPEAEHFLYPHDLALYGKPVDVREKNLYPVLRLLETFFVTHGQIQMGVAEKILIHREDDDISVHDVAGLRESHGAFMEFALLEGAILSLLRDEVRPVTKGVPNGDGNINPIELEGPEVHPFYAEMQNELLHRASVFIGFLLLLHYQIDSSLIEAFLRRLDSVNQIQLFASQEHLQFVLESEMFDLGNNLSRNDQGFEGRCLLAALQTLTRIL